MLVVATLMGFATVASAKFSDDSSINYKEAVEVMSMIDVINGYTDGSFRPTANVKRAEMAKMVAYIVSGGEDVGNLYAGANSFSDCTTHWAKGYIAYASKTGIVAGVGNGLFNPEGSVTGTQAAKMMLCALGYDAAIETYTGANWAVNVLADARDAGLLKGLSKVDMSAALSREAAAQMMFNALKATMVKYSNKGSNIIVDGITINTGASTAEPVANNASSYKKADTVDDDFTGTMQLCEKYFEDLELTVDADDFERPANIWTYEKDTVTAPATADYTYTAATAGEDVYADLGKSLVSDLKSDLSDEDHKALNVYRNGQPVTDTYANDILAALVKDNDDDLTEDGLLVEVYVADDKVDIVMIDTVLAQVTKVNDKDADNLKITLGAFGTFSEEDTDLDFSVYEEDDYVLVTGLDGRTKVLKSIAPAESFDGVLDSYKGRTVTIDGTKYNLSNNYDDIDGELDVLTGSETDYESTFTFYTDAYGYIIGSVMKEEVAAEGAYLFVSGSKTSGYDAFDGDASVKVAATFTDGTKKNVDLYVKDADSEDATVTTNGVPVKVSELDDNIATGWYSYTTNADGKYKITKIVADSNAGVKAFIGDAPEYEANSAVIKYNGEDTLRANSSTVLNLVGDGKTYTGYKNFVADEKVSGANDGEVLYVLSTKGGSVIKEILIAEDLSVTEDTTYAYVVGVEKTDANGTQYKFFVEGEAKYYYDATDDGLTDGSIVSITVNTDDEVTEATPANVYEGEVLSIEGSDYFTIGTGEADEDGEYATSETLYFEDVDNDTICEIYSADDGETMTLTKGDEVVVAYTGDCAVVAYVK